MIRRLAPSLFMILLLCLSWEAAVRTLDVPWYILPPPSQALRTAILRSPLLLSHSFVTGGEILLGIALALSLAVPLAVAMFFSPVLDRAFAPFLVASQAIPVFALAPLLIVWFGYGIGSKVVMAAIVIFFPITVNLLQGFRSCPQELRTLFRLMGASPWTTLRRLYWPFALPFFFSGLRVGVSVATIGAVIGEWVGSQKGLGYLMIQANARMSVDLVFAAIIWLSVMGLALWTLVGRIEKRIVRWKN